MITLVTGATGRVGSRFVPRLLADAAQTRLLVRDASAVEGLRQRGAEVVEGDLRDPEAVRRAVKGVDRVVHLAAAFRGVADQEVATAINQAATIDLARASLAGDTGRFVFASTTLVYGHGRGRPAHESDPLAPAHSYPKAKAAAEETLRELWRTEGLGLRILRFAFVYGEGDPHLAESLMWARTWPAHKRLQLVHHADVGQGLLRGLRADGIDGMTFNIADDAPVTALELHRINGELVPEGAASRPLDDPWEGITDTTAARETLGFRPIFPTMYAAKDAGAL
jgi:nucleoside-diphosphate-sugar epimerase